MTVLREGIGELVDLVAAGGVAVVSGPAGAGKSYTLRAAGDALRRREMPVVELRATAAMAAVPYGALLPLLARHDEQRTLTATALALLGALVGRPHAAVLVDDAHLLDGPSAGVLHQAVAAGLPAMVAIRDGADCPDAVARLVPDIGARHRAVVPLSEEETGTMLADVLGGDVDGRLGHVVHRRSGGLPLAVSALARVAVARGAAQQIGGTWRLAGALPVSTEVGALVRGMTDALDPEALEVAELVALADSLPEHALATLGATGAAERSERAGVLVFDAAGSATLAHPLLVDALLADLPALRRRRHLARLLTLFREPASLLDRVRVAEWSLALGEPIEPGEAARLADATEAVLPEQAERFLRAAVEGGGGVPARLRLAELLAHQHRADEARAVLDGIDPSSLDAEQAFAATLTRAFLLVFALADPDAALAALDGLPDVPPVVAARAAAWLYRGEHAAAANAAERLALDEGLPVGIRAHAALTRTSALSYLGDHDAFAAWVPIARRAADEGRDAIPEGPEAQQLMEGLAALHLDVDPRSARVLASAGRRSALERGADGERAQWEHQFAEAAMLAGDPASHLPALRGAATAPGRWAAMSVRLGRASLARSLALTGDLDAAAAELAGVRAVGVPGIVATALALAEAEVLACRGDLAGAAAIAAAAARSTGRADLWYAGLRFGRPVAAQFLAASERLRGAGPAAQRQHARAVLAHDPAAIEAAAAALADAGLGLFAVDATAQAAALALRLDPLDRAPLERARAVAARYPHLRSPLVAALGRPALTQREAAVAHAVAAGRTAREIAEDLGIGVRTVETHVARAYRKLGVSNRRELRAALHAP